MFSINSSEKHSNNFDRITPWLASGEPEANPPRPVRAKAHTLMVPESACSHAVDFPHRSRDRIRGRGFSSARNRARANGHHRSHRAPNRPANENRPRFASRFRDVRHGHPPAPKHVRGFRWPRTNSFRPQTGRLSLQRSIRRQHRRTNSTSAGTRQERKGLAEPERKERATRPKGARRQVEFS